MSDKAKGKMGIIARLSVDEKKVLQASGHDNTLTAVDFILGNIGNGIELNEVILSDYDDTVDMGRYCHYLMKWAFVHFLEEEPTSPISFEAFKERETKKGL